MRNMLDADRYDWCAGLANAPVSGKFISMRIDKAFCFNSGGGDWIIKPRKLVTLKRPGRSPGVGCFVMYCAAWNRPRTLPVAGSPFNMVMNKTDHVIFVSTL